MNFQKNVPFPHEKEQGKEHFQLQTFFSIGKEHKNCSVKPPQPAFHGMKNSLCSFHLLQKPKALAFLLF